MFSLKGEAFDDEVVPNKWIWFWVSAALKAETAQLTKPPKRPQRPQRPKHHSRRKSSDALKKLHKLQKARTVFSSKVNKRLHRLHNLKKHSSSSKSVIISPTCDLMEGVTTSQDTSIESTPVTSTPVTSTPAASPATSTPMCKDSPDQLASVLQTEDLNEDQQCVDLNNTGSSPKQLGYEKRSESGLDQLPCGITPVKSNNLLRNGPCRILNTTYTIIREEDLMEKSCETPVKVTVESCETPEMFTLQLSPDGSGVRELSRSPKEQLPLEVSPNLLGVRELMRSPKQQTSPDLSGIRYLMESPGVQKSPISRSKSFTIQSRCNVSPRPTDETLHDTIQTVSGKKIGDNELSSKTDIDHKPKIEAQMKSTTNLTVAGIPQALRRSVSDMLSDIPTALRRSLSHVTSDKPRVPRRATSHGPADMPTIPKRFGYMIPSVIPKVTTRCAPPTATTAPIPSVPVTSPASSVKSIHDRRSIKKAPAVISSPFKRMTRRGSFRRKSPCPKLATPISPSPKLRHRRRSALLTPLQTVFKSLSQTRKKSHGKNTKGAEKTGLPHQHDGRDKADLSEKTLTSPPRSRLSGILSKNVETKRSSKQLPQCNDPSSKSVKNTVKTKRILSEPGWEQAVGSGDIHAANLRKVPITNAEASHIVNPERSCVASSLQEIEVASKKKKQNIGTQNEEILSPKIKQSTKKQFVSPDTCLSPKKKQIARQKKGQVLSPKKNLVVSPKKNLVVSPKKSLVVNQKKCNDVSPTKSHVTSPIKNHMGSTKKKKAHIACPKKGQIASPKKRSSLTSNTPIQFLNTKQIAKAKHKQVIQTPTKKRIVSLRAKQVVCLEKIKPVNSKGKRNIPVVNSSKILALSPRESEAVSSKRYQCIKQEKARNAIPEKSQDVISETIRSDAILEKGRDASPVASQIENTEKSQDTTTRKTHNATTENHPQGGSKNYNITSPKKSSATNPEKIQNVAEQAENTCLNKTQKVSMVQNTISVKINHEIAEKIENAISEKTRNASAKKIEYVIPENTQDEIPENMLDASLEKTRDIIPEEIQDKSLEKTQDVSPEKNQDAILEMTQNANSMMLLVTSPTAANQIMKSKKTQNVKIEPNEVGLQINNPIGGVRTWQTARQSKYQQVGLENSQHSLQKKLPILNPVACLMNGKDVSTRNNQPVSPVNPHVVNQKKSHVRSSEGSQISLAMPTSSQLVKPENTYITSKKIQQSKNSTMDQTTIPENSQVPILWNKKSVKPNNNVMKLQKTEVMSPMIRITRQRTQAKHKMKHTPDAIISKSPTVLNDVPDVRKTRLAQKKGIGITALKLKSPLTKPANPASPIKKPRRGRPPKQEHQSSINSTTTSDTSRQSPKVEIKHQYEDSAKKKVTKARKPRTSKSSAVTSTVVSSPRKQAKRGRPSKQAIAQRKMAKVEATTSSPKTTRTTKAEQHEVEQSGTQSEAKKQSKPKATKAPNMDVSSPEKVPQVRRSTRTRKPRT